MVTRYLSQPNNVLINRLGLGANWKTPVASSYSTKKAFMLFRIFFTRFFSIIWRSGLLHANHLFAGRFFTERSVLTLPSLNRASDVSRYFRLVRIKFSTRFRGKRFFIARKYLQYLSISEFTFYKINGLTLVLLFCHIPEPLKRNNFLSDYLGVGSGVTLQTSRTHTLVPRLGVLNLLTKLNAFF